MDRGLASKLLREELDKNGLSNWGIRLNTNNSTYYLGLCSYKDKCIILNAHHIDQHPDIEIIDTIKHEVAHALTQGHQHDEVWAAKAKELGCSSTSPCATYSISEEVKDAIRSGATVEISFEEEIIRRPIAKITRLQDKCEFCGKVAIEISHSEINTSDDNQPNIRIIKLECGHAIIKKIPKGTPFHKLVSNWWEPHIKSCNHEFDDTSEDKRKCQKCGEFRLLPFQIEGARFTEQALSIQHGSGIFDEMGLGKTVQSLAYLRYHPEMFPVLFVVKSGIKFQWFTEILRWLGPEYLAQVIESSSDNLIPSLKCYIASFDIFTLRTKKGKSYQFDISKFDHIKTIISDEVQQIKNPDATRTQQFRKVCEDKKVIALSGTPWKNRGSEYFTILNILNPMKFPSHARFIREWVDTYYNYGGQTRVGGIKRINEFREYIKDICIRREVDEVMPEMPSVNRMLHFTELNDATREEYDDAENEFVRWFNDRTIGGESVNNFGADNIMAKLAKMRHINGLAKIPTTMEYCEEFLEETDRKLTIFVHHIDVGNILFNRIKNELSQKFKVDVFQLNSSMSGIDRFETQEAFNRSKRAILIASTLAAGEGINLQTCGDAILHERQWNPQNEDQAAPGRFRRIGSVHKTVNVTFMTASGTVDEILAGLVEKKRKYFHDVMNKGEMPQFSESMFAKELAEGVIASWNKKMRMRDRKSE